MWIRSDEWKHNKGVKKSTNAFSKVKINY
jgi:hypothetical protein